MLSEPIRLLCLCVTAKPHLGFFISFEIQGKKKTRRIQNRTCTGWSSSQPSFSCRRLSSLSAHLFLLSLQGICVSAPQAVRLAEREEERGDEERNILLRHAPAAPALPAGLARAHTGTGVSPTRRKRRRRKGMSRSRRRWRRRRRERKAVW